MVLGLLILSLGVLGGSTVGEARSPAEEKAATVPAAEAGRDRERKTERKTDGVGDATTPPVSEETETGRACDECPSFPLRRALLETTTINGLYGLGNLVRGQASARVTPASWWANLKHGWEWDLDDFLVNQIGHPFQGSNYFSIGRSNGLTFWESAAVAAFGSGTWEYFGETNRPSLNDFINTTLGGIALGETFHRTAWLIRDTQAEGGRQVWRELAAAAIDPITGAKRLLAGDASRIADPLETVSPTHSGTVSSGVLWRGSNTGVLEAKGQPFLEFDLLYGDSTHGRSRTPYDAYAVRLSIGGGGVFSEARVRGRLIGQPMGNGRIMLNVVQDFDFYQNDAYEFGAQAIAVRLALVGKPARRTRLWADAWGGATLLGAVDSRTRSQAAPPQPGRDEDRARRYDYGPGSNFGASAGLRRDNRLVVTAMYKVHHLYVLDGVQANHLLQRVRTDVLVPVGSRLGLGVSGEFFDRRTFYQASIETARFHYPQFRAYLAWHASNVVER